MSAYYFNFNECQDLSLTEIATQKCEPFFSYGPTVLNQYIFHYIISHSDMGLADDYEAAGYEKLGQAGEFEIFRIRQTDTVQP